MSSQEAAVPTGPDAASDDHSAPLISPGFVIVTLATFAYFLALGALMPTLPVFIETELGGGSVAVGVVVGSFAVSAAIARPLAGRIGDTHGRRVLMVGGALVMCISVFGYTLADNMFELVLLRLLSGLGEAGMWVGAATAIQDIAPEGRRGEAASYFSVALYAGLGFGPLAGEAIRSAWGFDLVWTIAAASSLVACLLAIWAPKGTRREPQPFRFLHPAAIGPGLILVLGMLPVACFATFLPLYGPEVGATNVGPFLLAYGLLVLIIRVLGARLPDRLGWTRATAASLVVLAAAGVVLGLWHTTAGIWVAVIALAVGQALLFPALFIATVSRASESERGQAVGTFSLAFDAAHGLGPAVLGVVVAVASYQLAFAITGLCALGGVTLVSFVARAPGAGR